MFSSAQQIQINSIHLQKEFKFDLVIYDYFSLMYNGYNFYKQHSFKFLYIVMPYNDMKV